MEVERREGRSMCREFRTGEFDSERFGCGWHVTTRHPSIGHYVYCVHLSSLLSQQIYKIIYHSG